MRQAVLPVIAWALLASAFAFFMLPTRVHERYLFPAVALAILLAGLTDFPRWGQCLAGAVTVSYLLNLAIAYGGIRDAQPSTLALVSVRLMLSGLALANLALFVVVLALPATPVWRASLARWAADHADRGQPTGRRVG